METSIATTKKKRGQQLQNAERVVLIGKLIDELCQGYMTTNALSKKLNVSPQTIDNYRAVADKVIREQKLDRNVIRNLQLQRTYKIIEMLMDDLSKAESVKDRALLYNQIYKFSSHLALITGLNVETQVNVEASKLVIIRSGKKPDITEVAANVSQPQ